jgi:hypothetical protein
MSTEPHLWGLSVTNWVTIGSTIFGAALIVGGWFLNSHLVNEQALHNRQAELRTAYMVDAYEKFATASNREMTPEYASMIESAVAKVQLFGTEKEVDAVNHFLDTWNQPQPDHIPRGDLNPILFALRDSLRQEIALPKIEGPVRWIRLRGGKQ